MDNLIYLKKMACKKQELLEYKSGINLNLYQKEINFRRKSYLIISFE